MVVKKRQNRYDFNGFNVASVPKAPRSARGGRCVHHGKKVKVNDGEICAIELLASLAGKLLQESEGSSASSNAPTDVNNRSVFGDIVIKPERDEGKPLKMELFNLRICEGSIALPEFVPTQVKESAKVENESVPERSSVILNSESSEKVQHVVYDSKTVHDNEPGKIDGGSPDSVESSEFCRPGSKDTIELCGELPALVNLDNNVSDLGCNVSISRHKNSVQSIIRDDDEKFTKYNKLINKPKGYGPAPRISDHRIRKLLQSKYWKAAPKSKDGKLPKGDGGLKPPYRKRKACYSRERCQRNALHKRRKFPNHSFVVTSDGAFSCESVCNSPQKGFAGDCTVSTTMFCGVNGASSSVEGHGSSLPSKDSRGVEAVKFSIKSFRIPDLLIEVPENATVGSLKRTVMEAVTAILEGGLRVGLLLHGKKVRDDNRTLLQTGITSHDNLDTLDFTLEPSSVLAPPPLYNEEQLAPLPHSTPQLVSRSSASEISDALPEQFPLTTPYNNNTEVKKESGSPDTNILAEKTLLDSRALVLVPPASAEALGVVSVSQKSRRSELVHRRTRRPFSVAEVEALVKAVEELGPGRWRDVKLRSFENADHRTYVDLKDKWKTLVHTAKIAPQQRRGEPVPQELLDRVLAAHAYWSQHQAKQHSKNILEITDTQITRTDGIPSI